MGFNVICCGIEKGIDCKELVIVGWCIIFLLLEFNCWFGIGVWDEGIVGIWVWDYCCFLLLKMICLLLLKLFWEFCFCRIFFCKGFVFCLSNKILFCVFFIFDWFCIVLGCKLL